MDKILLVSTSDEQNNLKGALRAIGCELSNPGESCDAILATARDADGARLSSIIRAKEVKNKVPLLLALDPAGSHQNSPLLEMADDFIFLPLNPGELALRLSALFKKSRLAEEAPETVVCGDLVANRLSLSVFVAGQKRSLTVLEFKLLWFLMQNNGTVVSRPMILQNVWKGTVVSNRTIDAHIVSLRRNLMGMQFSIDTVYGAGYVLRGKEARVAYLSEERKSA